jgi:hypothetical protein
MRRSLATGSFLSDACTARRQGCTPYLDIYRECHEKLSLRYPGNIGFQSVGLRGSRFVELSDARVTTVLDWSSPRNGAVNLNRRIMWLA